LIPPVLEYVEKIFCQNAPKRWAVMGLGRIPSSSIYPWARKGGERFAISRFRGTPEKRYEKKSIQIQRDLEIPVRVPAIKTCFMSIDEIARIFSKS